ncbi:MAG: hypothetical protein Q9226_007893, partial [Calogaya cf. arnoldii]
ARPRNINMSEYSPPIVRRMITFCYTLDYNVNDEADYKFWGVDHTSGGSPDLTPVSVLDLHGQMYSIAKKLGIGDLERLAASKFGCLSEIIARTSIWDSDKLSFGELVGMVPSVDDAAFESNKGIYQDLVDAIT